MNNANPLARNQNKNPEFDFGTLALQDGLGFKKMKLIEIFRNYKKLKYS
jgi:hypothetical protein